MLRASALSTEVEPAFDRRVVRRARLQGIRDGFGYWSPAAIGATVAAVLILALLQIVARPNGLPENRVPEGEARRTIHVPAIPDLAPVSQPRQ